MNTCTRLPEDYREILKVDLQKNKKEALIVNGIALVITVVMMVIGCLLVPFWTIYDNFLQLIMLNSTEVLTISLGIAKLQSEMSTDYGLIMAGAALGSIPIIIIFLMFQKFFTRGITMGAVKG